MPCAFSQLNNTSTSISDEQVAVMKMGTPDIFAHCFSYVVINASFLLYLAVINLRCVPIFRS